MPSLATIVLVVPLVWPSQFVGPDVTCFVAAESADAPVRAVPLPPEPAPEPVALPIAESEPLRRPIAVAVWGEVALVTIPAEDAG